MEVRSLRKADEASYRALRIESIEQAPDLATPRILQELDNTRNANAVLDAYGPQQCVFGTFYGGSLVGVVAMDASPDRLNPHDIELWGLYVVPRLRGTPVSQLLLEAAIAWARHQPGKLTVSVEFARSNRYAFRFFDRNYFSVRPPQEHEERFSQERMRMDYFLGE